MITIKDQVKYMLDVICNIEEYCFHRNCSDCPFHTGQYECQMETVADSLEGYPVAWDITAIEYVKRKLKL